MMQKSEATPRQVTETQARSLRAAARLSCDVGRRGWFSRCDQEVVRKPPRNIRRIFLLPPPSGSGSGSGSTARVGLEPEQARRWLGLGLAG